MTQQPNQNYPQPGQGWGQQPQQPQQPQWGQPQAQPAAPQWGQPQVQQPVYGQPPQQQWGMPSGGAAAVGPVAGSPLAKAWAVFGAVGAAALAAVMVFFPWGSEKVTADGKDLLTLTISAMGHASVTLAGTTHSGDADGFNKIWGILLIVSGVVALAGGLLAFFLKSAKLVWVLVAGAGLVAVFGVVEMLYLQSKWGDEKKSMADTFGSTPTARYSLGLGWAAYVSLLLAVVAAVLAVLAALANKNGAGTTAAATPYGLPYGQPAADQGYGQPAYGQQGYQQQPQWGAPAQPQQPQWGQSAAPQQQPQWGGPSGQQETAQAPNPFADPANQPTQAVQQYPPTPPQ